MPSHRIDFTQLKAHISIQDIVEKLQLEFTQKGAQLQGNCPFPNHVGDRNSRSFSIHTDKDIYICPTHCGSGVGCIDFYCALKGVDRHRNALQAAIALQTMFDIPKDLKNAQNPLKQPLNESWQSARTQELHNPVKNLHIDLKKNVPYLLQQKQLTPQTIQYFDIGQALVGTLKEHIAIPMHNTQGKRIGYAGQNLQIKQWKFYFNKSIELFNYHRVKALSKEYVLVVEGFYSAMYLWQCGFKNAVALMGSRASQRQAQLITQLSENVRLFLDNDTAGRQGTQQVKELLQGKVNQLKAVVYSDDDYRIKPIQFEKSQLKAMIF